MAASCRQLQVEVLLDRLLHELVDHLRCVRLVLDMLRQHELRLKQSKCAQVCVRCTHSVIPRTHGVHRRHGDGQPEGPGGGGLDAPALSSGIARLPRPRRANTAMFICKYYLDPVEPTSAPLHVDAGIRTLCDLIWEQVTLVLADSREEMEWWHCCLNRWDRKERVYIWFWYGACSWLLQCIGRGRDRWESSLLLLPVRIGMGRDPCEQLCCCACYAAGRRR
ncbi:hypothetical protein SEVIR_9G045402v4 [Setaria viridis]